MSTQPLDPKRINASPTKEFFMHMLVRDIPLNRAVIDLVDNSVDGAHRIKDGCSYSGLWIRIELNAERFRIADNCGGIPLDIARDYAFRFGRAKDAPETAGSIGQFGVGMKRTFFKLGNFFRVQSAAPSSRFTVEIDLDEWKSRKGTEGADDWHFEFKELDPEAITPPEQQGTIIEIEHLHSAVKESFAQDVFINRLAQEIAIAHALSLDKGLSITLNGVPLRHDPLSLLSSAEVQPAHVELRYADLGPRPVRVMLYAGLAQRSKEEGGWYVFCNGRMVLRADQSNVTVWGEGDRVPKYHPDFARFRGLAYFDSDDSGLLPWTTTKTGVDADSPVYRAVRQQMIELTRPVLDFLRKLEEERRKSEEGDISDTPLAAALGRASESSLQQLPSRPVFSAPKPPPPPPGPPMQKIQYSKPLDDVNRVKKLLGVYQFKDVGERTFDYYLKYEGGGDAT